MNKAGYFIVLEGVDGSGKDTILQNISSLFFTKDVVKKSLSLNQKKYHNFLITYEPTTSSLEGRKIYEGGNNLSLLPFSKYSSNKLVDLYVKDRIKHSKFIRQALLNDVTVLCSRYDLSTYAYQMNLECPFETIYQKHLYDEPRGVLIPDLTLFLSVSEETSKERVDMKDQKNKDNYDMDQRSLKKVIQSYGDAIQRLKKKQPKRKIVEINASRPLETVVHDCVEEIRGIFKQQDQTKNQNELLSV